MIVITILSCLISLGAIYSVYRLNKYIQSLEEEIDRLSRKTTTLQQSLSKVVKNNLLNDNGTLKNILLEEEDYG
mgnify:FL=1